MNKTDKLLIACYAIAVLLNAAGFVIDIITGRAINIVLRAITLFCLVFTLVLVIIRAVKNNGRE
ncbi:MAG: hypothetical protein K6F15_04150 [Treponema sp.]|nr:hypothetical protein [Treponema sp.]